MYSRLACLAIVLSVLLGTIAGTPTDTLKGAANATQKGTPGPDGNAYYDCLAGSGYGYYCSQDFNWQDYANNLFYCTKYGSTASYIRHCPGACVSPAGKNAYCA